MPRPNPSRTLDVERNLARRIAHERRLRNLSYAALAQLMTDAGCPIASSALFKIEKGDPPRGVSATELVALGKVWDLPVDGPPGSMALLKPMELVEAEWAEEVATEFVGATAGLDDAHAALVRAALSLAEVHRQSPRVTEAVMHRWKTASPGRQWFSEFNGKIDDDQLENLVELGNAFWEQALAVVDDLAGRGDS